MLATAFTGKERDAETGLDYFGARYYSGAQGRFTSPDPEYQGAKLEDPQSWNGYAYGRNNPLKYVDPDGLAYRVCEVDSDGKEFNCGNVNNDRDFGRYAKSQGWTLKGNRLLNQSGNQIGTANYFDPAPMEALVRGTQQAGPVVEAAGWGTLGIMAGAGGAALAGGSGIASLGSITPQAVISGGAATAYGYQLLKDSYRSLELIGEALGGVANAANRVIGGGTSIRDVQRLVATYGGKTSDWVKVTTPEAWVQRGRAAATAIEVHFYQNVTTGQIVELKTKLVR